MPTERADAIIKLIESQIETDRHLEPKPPVEDSPQINITDIEMTTPPAYQAGDKVSKVPFLPKSTGLLMYSDLHGWINY